MKFLRWEIVPAKEVERKLRCLTDRIWNNEQRISSLTSACVDLHASLDEYKKLYLDEQKKRLEMAELVRKMEAQHDS